MVTRLYKQLSVITIARLLINIGVRMVYPFAPAFARGLGLPIADVYRIIAFRNVFGFLGPLFSPLSERYGRKPVIIGSILLFGAGGLVVVLRPTYWALGATLSVFALSKVIFDPAMQSYVSERVPYKDRGKAISFTELAWAGSLLIGGPAVSLVIARQGWQAPFFWLAVMGTAAAVALWRFIPRTHTNASNGAVNLRQAGQVFMRQRVVWAAMAYITLVMASNETLLIVFGDWMEGEFGLGLVALGFSAGVIGGAEVVGEVAAGWSVDRFGKRPVIMTTAVCTAVVTLLLPLTSISLVLALLAYFGVFLFFEITVVGGIPLLTEIVPSDRAVVMSFVLAASGLGRMVGAWLGAILFARIGFWGNGLVAALLMITAVTVLFLWVREGTATEMIEQELMGEDVT